MTVKRFHPVLVSIAMLLISGVTCAAESGEEELTEYEVELIIFEDAQARYMHSESWLPKHSRDSENGDDKKADQATGPVTGKFERISAGMLDRQYRRLGLSSEVKILYRTAWRQPGLDASQAFSIDLNNLRNQHQSRSKNSVTGSVKLVLARYLHLYTDIDYHRPADRPVETQVESQADSSQSSDLSQETVTTRPVTDFEFDMHRRMRSKELHYIDHPLIGMLVKIIPVEKPEEEKPQEEKTQG